MPHLTKSNEEVLNQLLGNDPVDSTPTPTTASAQTDGYSGFMRPNGSGAPLPDVVPTLGDNPEHVVQNMPSPPSDQPPPEYAHLMNENTVWIPELGMFADKSEMSLQNAGKAGRRSKNKVAAATMHSGIQKLRRDRASAEFRQVYELALVKMGVEPTRALPPERAGPFFAAIQMGMTVRGAAALIGVGGSTITKWQRFAKAGHPAFELIWALVETAEARLEQRMVEAWEAHVEDNWQAASTFLARRFSDRWADRQQVEISTTQLKDMSIEELERIAATGDDSGVIDIQQSEPGGTFDYIPSSQQQAQPAAHVNAPGTPHGGPGMNAAMVDALEWAEKAKVRYGFTGDVYDILAEVVSESFINSATTDPVVVRGELTAQIEGSVRGGTAPDVDRARAKRG